MSQDNDERPAIETIYTGMLNDISSDLSEPFQSSFCLSERLPVRIPVDLLNFSNCLSGSKCDKEPQNQNTTDSTNTATGIPEFGIIPPKSLSDPSHQNDGTTKSGVEKHPGHSSSTSTSHSASAAMSKKPTQTMTEIEGSSSTPSSPSFTPPPTPSPSPMPIRKRRPTIHCIEDFHTQHARKTDSAASSSRNRPTHSAWPNMSPMQATSATAKRRRSPPEDGDDMSQSSQENHPDLPSSSAKSMFRSPESEHGTSANKPKAIRLRRPSIACADEDLPSSSKRKSSESENPVSNAKPHTSRRSAVEQQAHSSKRDMPPPRSHDHHQAHSSKTEMPKEKSLDIQQPTLMLHRVETLQESKKPPKTNSILKRRPTVDSVIVKNYKRSSDEENQPKSMENTCKPLQLRRKSVTEWEVGNMSRAVDETARNADDDKPKDSRPPASTERTDRIAEYGHSSRDHGYNKFNNDHYSSRSGSSTSSCRSDRSSHSTQSRHHESSGSMKRSRNVSFSPNESEERQLSDHQQKYSANLSDSDEPKRAKHSDQQSIIRRSPVGSLWITVNSSKNNVTNLEIDDDQKAEETPPPIVPSSSIAAAPVAENKSDIIVISTNDIAPIPINPANVMRVSNRIGGTDSGDAALQAIFFQFGAYIQKLSIRQPALEAETQTDAIPSVVSVCTHTQATSDVCTTATQTESAAVTGFAKPPAVVRSQAADFDHSVGAQALQFDQHPLRLHAAATGEQVALLQAALVSRPVRKFIVLYAKHCGHRNVSRLPYNGITGPRMPTPDDALLLDYMALLLQKMRECAQQLISDLRQLGAREQSEFFERLHRACTLQCNTISAPVHSLGWLGDLFADVCCVSADRSPARVELRTTPPPAKITCTIATMTDDVEEVSATTSQPLASSSVTSNETPVLLTFSHPNVTTVAPIATITNAPTMVASTIEPMVTYTACTMSNCDNSCGTLSYTSVQAGGNSTMRGPPTMQRYPMASTMPPSSQPAGQIASQATSSQQVNNSGTDGSAMAPAATTASLPTPPTMQRYPLANAMASSSAGQNPASLASMQKVNVCYTNVVSTFGGIVSRPAQVTDATRIADGPVMQYPPTTQAMHSSLERSTVQQNGQIIDASLQAMIAGQLQRRQSQAKENHQQPPPVQFPGAANTADDSMGQHRRPLRRSSVSWHPSMMPQTMPLQGQSAMQQPPPVQQRHPGNAVDVQPQPAVRPARLSQRRLSLFDEHGHMARMLAQQTHPDAVQIVSITDASELRQTVSYGKGSQQQFQGPNGV